MHGFTGRWLSKAASGIAWNAVQQPLLGAKAAAGRRWVPSDNRGATRLTRSTRPL